MTLLSRAAARLIDGRTLSRRLLNRELRNVLSGATAHSVLDVGGASGVRYRNLVRAERYWTIDLQSKYRPNVRGDAHALPFATRSIDLVLSIQVLEHCINPAAAIHEIARVLRPGGRMVLSTVLLYELHGSPHDYYRFTAAALEDLTRGFASVKISILGNRFVAAYDLTCARSVILNSLFGRIAYRMGTHASPVCPCGFVLDARIREA